MFETLKDILVNKLKVSPDTITADSTPEEIDLDSLAIVELSLVLEKELDLAVSEDELTEAETVGDIVRLMDERSAKV